ncbi:hypothetical protein PtA15_5A476 [Puccinia triticina]|uniref:Uncharacterized protein n=1 Tax=Puccinia triticina TaxID=208348 RepID=A0ABY7CJ09_9BASI|nr:uncharacterized protein PtA15_5A476 [Puccinia triticina]WAQ84903.1 hypothetical protein PtA15_5A476 [Puccinia triticina]
MAATPAPDPAVLAPTSMEMVSTTTPKHIDLVYPCVPFDQCTAGPSKPVTLGGHPSNSQDSWGDRDGRHRGQDSSSSPVYCRSSPGCRCDS